MQIDVRAMFRRCQSNVQTMSDHVFFFSPRSCSFWICGERTQSAARRILSHSTLYWPQSAHKNVMRCHRASGVHYGDICPCQAAREEPNWRELGRQDPQDRRQCDRSRTAAKRPLTPSTAGFVALHIGEIFAVMYQGGMQHAPRARAA